MNKAEVESSTREDLVLRHIGFAEAVSLKMSVRLPIDGEEAIAVGRMGLVEASRRISFERYDANRVSTLDANFRSMAYPRIRGAILDYCRMHYTKRRNYENGDRHHQNKLSFNPALHSPVSSSSSTHIATEWRCAVNSLSHREKVIVVGSVSGFSGREMADHMGISQARVSQILGGARKKIDEQLSTSD